LELQALARSCAGLAAALLIAGCGGGGGTEEPAAGNPPPVAAAPEMPANRAEAARFLNQASFGATDASIDRVMAVGYAAWIDEQLALPASSHRTAWEAADAAIKRDAPSSSAGTNEVLDAFWQQALTAPDQLRQRWAYALSQTFVISLADGNVGNQPRAAAAWMDMLGTQGTGSYRVLLENVSLHPLMGTYLSHLKNRRADDRTGRVPDENYAREVMQLFSIGLVELNPDGSSRLNGGQAIETYAAADIGGLARVFTGFSWACPDWPSDGCFNNGSQDGVSDPERWTKSMLGYPQYHSPDAKSFLGVTIAAQSLPDPPASLRVALDTLAAHANVGPFIGRQMIQRLVTSNPSPAYVQAVAQAFSTSGGNLGAMAKAILMHPEARRTGDRDGKLREPVLRLAAYLRAFPHTSDTNRWRVGNTDNPASGLGQSPLRSPSVFNFYRPGYAAPGTQSAAAGLVAPELQITHETSVAGYVNFMRDNLSSGVGQRNSTVGGVALNRRDLQRDWTEQMALTDDPAALVAHVVAKLLPSGAPQALTDEIVAAVTAIVIPSPTASNAAAIETARRNRVFSTVLLVLVAPEFQVQK
jgi:uncharacterized protein (DUF1800 family)